MHLNTGKGITKFKNKVNKALFTQYTNRANLGIGITNPA